MNQIRDIFSEMRPVNTLLTAVSVWTGFYVSTGSLTGTAVAAAAISAACICAGGNIFNDYFDTAIDRINRPERPYTAGRLQKRAMMLTGALLFLSGLLFSFFLGVYGVFLVLLTIAGLMIYNMKAKRVLLLGNSMIGILSGFAFLYGGIAGGSLKGAAVPAVFAAVFHFGRELLKDIEDREGDSSLRIATFPVKYSDRAALKMASAAYGVLIVFTLLPYVFLEYSVYYLYTVLCGVDLLIVILITRYWVSQERKHLQQTNSLLKAGMVFGLLAMVLK